MKPVAKVIIHKSQGMDSNARKVIARWLMEQAQAFIKDGGNYSNRFSSTYLVKES